MTHFATTAVACFASCLCAGAPPSRTDTEAQTLVRPSTQAQQKVAHFRSADGTLGFILDRSTEPAKLRFDGQKDVIELTFVEDLKYGQRRGFTYKQPDGKSVLTLDIHGNIRAITRQGELPVLSDRKEDPLPKATIRGQYVAPQSPYERAVEILAPRTVMARFPRFKPEDSGNLTEVEKAFELVDVSMLVRINSAGTQLVRWAPASDRIGDTVHGLGGILYPRPLNDRAWDPSATGLARYGAILIGDRPTFSKPSRLALGALKGWPAPLALNTPGILWSLLNGTLVFVTLDGGRYQISLSELTEDTGLPVTLGLAPEATWPAPLQHSLVDVESIRGLAKGEALPQSVADGIEALDDAWFHCVNGVWAEAATELEKAGGPPGSTSERQERVEAVKMESVRRASRHCEPTKLRLEEGLVAFIEARDTARKALDAKNRARIREALAAPKNP